MRIETILNHLEPHKGFVYKGCKLNRESDTLEVMIAERDGSRVSCPVCGKRCPVYDHRPVRRYESIPYILCHFLLRQNKLLVVEFLKYAQFPHHPFVLRCVPLFL